MGVRPAAKFWHVKPYFDSMQRLREVLARSPPGTQAEGSLQTPSCQINLFENKVLVQLAVLCTLKPVGHQSTNWIVRLVLMVATAACTSLGTTSPRYNRQQATKASQMRTKAKRGVNILYFPSLGSHFTIWLPFSKQENVISATEFCSWFALSADKRGAYVARGKWIRGKLTECQI